MWFEMAHDQTTCHYIVTIALQKLCPASFTCKRVWWFYPSLALSRNFLQSLQPLLREVAASCAKGHGAVEAASLESLSRRKFYSLRIKITPDGFPTRVQGRQKKRVQWVIVVASSRRQIVLGVCVQMCEQLTWAKLLFCSWWWSAWGTTPWTCPCSWRRAPASSTSPSRTWRPGCPWGCWQMSPTCSSRPWSTSQTISRYKAQPLCFLWRPLSCGP